MKIATDFHSVLADIHAPMSKLIKFKWGIEPPPHGANTWNRWEEIKLPKEDWWDTLHTIYGLENGMMTMPLEDKLAPPTLSYLKTRGHIIDIVTSIRDDMRQQVVDWLNFHNIEYDNLVIVKAKVKDAKKDLKDYDVLIDDSPYQTVSFAENNPDSVVMVFNQNWNQDVLMRENMIRVNGWKDIRQFFRDIEERDYGN